MKPPKQPLFKHDSQMPPIFVLSTDKEKDAQTLLHLSVVYSVQNPNDLIERKEKTGDPTEGFLKEISRLRKIGIVIDPIILREIVIRTSYIRKYGWKKYRQMLILKEQQRKALLDLKRQKLRWEALD